MRDKREKYKIFTRRALITGAVKATLLSCLIGRFYYLQILTSDEYKTLSNKNRLRIFLTQPKRGQILDGNGVALAENIKTYALLLKREYKTQIKTVVAKINDIMVDQKVNISLIPSKNKGISHIQPIKLFENLSLQNAILLDANPELIETEIKESFIRYYPLKEKAFHITGYLGSTNKTDVKEGDVKKQYDFAVGKDGVEKQFNEDLTGQPGMEKIEVDAKGNFIRSVDFSSSVPGNDIKLSINNNVQNILCNHMHGYTGAIVVMDLTIQKIIGLVSSPTINPNIFIEGLSHDDWKTIKTNKQNPLINKCISAKYPPGSIFKLVMFLAILKQGLDPEHRIFCPGYHKVGNTVYGCWKKSGHGYMNLENALAQSCNVYFFEQSLKVGINRIYEIANLLGLSQKTNIELPFEMTGLIPTKEWKKRRYKLNWYPGDTINTSIGQGYVETTPIQLLQMTARIAAKKNLSSSIITSKLDEAMVDNLNVNHQHLVKLRAALLKVFYDPNGTGYNERIEDPEYQIAGKSGTSQVVGTKHNSKNALYQDNSLFVGFAPFHNPRFVISTVIENGGWGSKTATPISKNILLDIKALNLPVIN
ncbi:penicillin-binding protein 2 [Candidatus Bandiella euplotis]|uniref:Penicillin-binding protein 2 n=1 Tax=Candidatus Bandiella euplotis TaxID=1664265 RepID=A0ABZ0URP6_9RICK|nr:penicillin-binding protein 2 [Candidatus Bandiella woodruffii]WPX96710.1 Penicillin-binding protein 2 [Candidatus Bandiella woodruffii]